MDGPGLWVKADLGVGIQQEGHEKEWGRLFVQVVFVRQFANRAGFCSAPKSRTCGRDDKKRLDEAYGGERRYGCATQRDAEKHAGEDVAQEMHTQHDS